jgi:hypothetical protein
MNEWLTYLGGLLVNEGTSATVGAKFVALAVGFLSAAIVAGSFYVVASVCKVIKLQHEKRQTV